MIFDWMHFTYGTYDSREHDLVFAHIDTSEFNSISGTIESYTVFNKRTMSRIFIGNDYSSMPLSIEVEIVTEDAIALNHGERTKAENALFNSPSYIPLYFDLEDDCFHDTFTYYNGEIKRYYLTCRFLNPERILDQNGLAIGWKCTMECDTGYMRQEPITVTHSHSSTNTSFDLDVVCNGNDYIYPKVTLQMGSTKGQISITNQADDSSRITKFENLSPSVSVIINGETNYVSGNHYQFMTNRNFPRLVNGLNSITVNGVSCTLTVEWSNRKYF